MPKTTIEKLNPVDVYISERNACVKKIAVLDINIKLCSRMDPDTIVFKKPLAKNERGEVLSSEEVRAGEHLTNLLKDREVEEAKIDAIDILIKDA